ncbi:hypothetical protein [Halorubrum sp. Boch-26]|uniref:hypothetical protein n=1 Tax=Halorubrum sp. Boch-26 TaxID=2994426 RepID=UPI002469C376|nr:hypothetical protein [Halorubrum sp. Boch-26]
MHDELPAPSATDEQTGDSVPESADDQESVRTDDRPDRSNEPPATGSAPLRARDGVDPPDGSAGTAPDGSARTAPGGSARTAPDAPLADSSDEADESADEEPLAYRLERLRLWRTLATLAVVVARLIRPL